MKHLFAHRLAVAASCGLMLSGAFVAPVHAQTYSAPLVINDSNCPSNGCSFSGNWESGNPDVAAVTINTSRPVIIQNSRVRGKGHLIQAGWNANLTVRSTRGYGQNPNIAGRTQGRFVQSDGATNLIVENCYIEGTLGIYLFGFQGDGTSNRAVRIRYNRVRNIDGRKSDGSGGYLSGASDFDWAQFVQLNQCNNMGGTEISWNEVVNHPFQSRVEDNINILWSSGTSTSPLLIRDNYIQGGYPADPVNMDYSGGGILLSDGGSNYVSAYSNQVVSTSNYGIAIQGGHDNNFHDNRIVASGYLPDGRYIKSMNVGAMIWNINNFGDFYNNTAWNNQIGWYRTSGYGEMWFPNAESEYARNQGFSPVTAEDERDEWTYWKAKSGTTSIGPSTSESNRVSNPSFDAQTFDAQTISGWSEWGGPNGSYINASYTETWGGAKSGARHGTHYRYESAYEVGTNQTKTGLPNGLYTLSAWVRGTSHVGGVAQMEAWDYGGAKKVVPIPVTDQWTRVELRDIQVSNGKCVITFYSRAQAREWIHFDDVELRKQ